MEHDSPASEPKVRKTRKRLAKRIGCAFVVLSIGALAIWLNQRPHATIYTTPDTGGGRALQFEVPAGWTVTSGKQQNGDQSYSIIRGSSYLSLAATSIVSGMLHKNVQEPPDAIGIIVLASPGNGIGFAPTGKPVQRECSVGHVTYSAWLPGQGAVEHIWTIRTGSGESKFKHAIDLVYFSDSRHGPEALRLGERIVETMRIVDAKKQRRD